MTAKPYDRRSFLARVAGSTLLVGGAASTVSGCALTGTDFDPTDAIGRGGGRGGGGASAAPTRDPNTAYGQRGWNGADYISYNQTYTDQDINGEVGHPLTVYGPYGECGNGAAYTRSVYVQSGTLPPGLAINSSTGVISGIPTERGHWIVTMSNSASCSSVTFGTKTQQLRFHITGSGQVIQ